MARTTAWMILVAMVACILCWQIFFVPSRLIETLQTPQPPKLASVVVTAPQPPKPLLKKDRAHLWPLAGWSLQVGVFNDSAHAMALVQRLRHAGFTAYKVSVQKDSSQRYPVRVGPFLKRATLLEVREKLAQKLHLKSFAQPFAKTS